MEEAKLEVKEKKLTPQEFYNSLPEEEKNTIWKQSNSHIKLIIDPTRYVSEAISVLENQLKTVKSPVRIAKINNKISEYKKVLDIK